MKKMMRKRILSAKYFTEKWNRKESHGWHSNEKWRVEPSKDLQKFWEKCAITALVNLHLHFLATEVYKSVNNLNPLFMWNYFNFSTLPYKLRKGNKVNLPETWTCRYGINSLLFREALLWNNLSRNVKESHSEAQFTEKIKELGNLTCSCVMCG